MSSISTLSESAESALIATAQERGHTERDTALVTLWAYYQPAVRNVLKRYRDSLPAEDAEQEAYAAFLETVMGHDLSKSPRLAGRITEALTHALDRAAVEASSAWAIPYRTLQRFHGILRRAEGDVEEGARLAPSYQMPTETFLRIANLLRQTGTLDLAPTEEERFNTPAAEVGSLVGAADRDPFVDADDRMLADIARAAVTDTQRAITDRAYGFVPVEVDGALVEPVVSDALIAADLGMSRATVQRQRVAALNTMRQALGL